MADTIQLLIFEIEGEEGAFGYEVGNVVQEYKPGVEGFVRMTLEEAQYYGKVVAARLLEV